MIVDAWLPRAAAARPRGSAIEAGGEKLDYAQLLAAATLGASNLAESGVRAGDEVAIALPPGIGFAIALHSCWLAGAAVVPIDLRLSAAERAAHAAGVVGMVRKRVSGDGAQELRAADVSTPAAEAPRTPTAAETPAGTWTHDLDAVAAVIHTSGTTSQPKRVRLTFGNLLWSALGSAVALGGDPNERWLSTLPVCHVGGLSILVRSAIAGTTAVVHERFDTQAALDALMHERITLVSVVATTLARLLDAGLADPPHLRCALAGGGPVPQALLDRAARAGVRVSQTYGLTESCSQATTVPLAALDAPGRGLDAPDAADRAFGAPAGMTDSSGCRLGAGQPLFCTRVRIADDGEILLRGATIAAGAVGRDGWLHTGDVGALDAAGNLHVTGRKADTIISGGENVAPAEVEAVLEEHPLVAEAAVFGRSDPEWGEVVSAIVVPRPGAAPSERELREHCAARLAGYKVPKTVRLVSDPLPRTRSGKLLRWELA